ncbi:MAG: HIT family protein [Gammaproteobacteria bacterium]|nr:HIT family protein [Gammaproteobacteria bacterium]
MSDCIFCKIAKKEEKSYLVWEDASHIAFLSIFPNTEGVTVVIPKSHYSSYAFDLDDNVLTDLILATKKVAKLLDEKLEDVGRTAMVFEGFGVDHVHAKLFPMHGTAKKEEWKPIHSNVDKFFERYEGYISSHDYKLADPTTLENTLKKICAE